MTRTSYNLPNHAHFLIYELDWKWSSVQARTGMVGVQLLIEEIEIKDSIVAVDR